MIGEYGESLLGLALFGSVATGRWSRDGSIDMPVVREGWDRKKAWERVDELDALKRKLAASAEYAEAVKRGYRPVIQNVPLAPEDLTKMSTFLLDVAFEGIFLFDKDGTMARFINAANE
jgi:predicted nucleotidyltransferase